MALCFVTNMRGVGISPPSLPLDLPLIVKLYMIQCKCKNKLQFEFGRRWQKDLSVAVHYSDMRLVSYCCLFAVHVATVISSCDWISQMGKPSIFFEETSPSC